MFHQKVRSTYVLFLMALLSLVASLSQATELKNPDIFPVKIISEADVLNDAPSFWIGFDFILPKGQKIQADKNSSAHPKIELKDAENVKAISIAWPKAETVKLYGIKTYVFPKSFILPVKVYPKEPGKPVTFKGKLTFVTCDELCVPIEENFHLALPTGTWKPSKDNERLQSAVQAWKEEQDPTRFVLILLAILGGFILNLMPCVLPVLALKFLGVMASKSSDQPKSSFFMSICGIFTSFIVLASLAVILRQTGVQVGWGMHFQQPGFLAVMISIMTLFSLNLWGLFEVQLPLKLRNLLGKWTSRHDEKHLLGSYLSGIFATLLATPCTAPFLSIALGFALTHGIKDIYLIFLCVAFGFSLPYWILILIPSRWIPHPKPGMWMIWLKRFLSVCLMATAVWLSYVWYAGSRSEPTTLSKGIWHAFEPEKISALTRSGKIVLVNVTAKWCLTCHVNQNFLDQSREVQKLVASGKLYLMQADWTRRDDAIALYLKTFNRSGIPFTVIYGPNEVEGAVLPELLTATKLLHALDQLDS